MRTLEHAAAERAAGKQVSRTKSLVGAAVVGIAAATLTYRLLRGGAAEAEPT
jgi:hypothetical protein